MLAWVTKGGVRFFRSFGSCRGAACAFQQIFGSPFRNRSYGPFAGRRKAPWTDSK